MGRWQVGAGAVAVFAALACGGGPAKDVETVPVTPPPPVADAGSEEPGGEAVGDAAGEGPTSWTFAPWPAPSLDGLPGWMAVRAGATDGPYWTHISGTTHLVVIGESWKDVPPGTVVDAVGPAGRTPVTFRGVQTARFGCDGGTELPVGAFEGEPPGDLVWLVPPGVALEAAKVTTVDGAGSRTWRTDTAALGVKVLTPTTFALWVGAEDKVLGTTDMAEIAMDGWDPEPVDVTGDFFVPQVVGAWTAPGKPAFAASAWSSFEGIHFTVFVLGEPPTETEVESLYSCAF